MFHFGNMLVKTKSIHTPLASNVNGVTGRPCSKITEMGSDYYKTLPNSVKTKLINYMFRHI